MEGTPQGGAGQRRAEVVRGICEVTSADDHTAEGQRGRGPEDQRGKRQGRRDAEAQRARGPERQRRRDGERQRRRGPERQRRRDGEAQRRRGAEGQAPKGQAPKGRRRKSRFDHRAGRTGSHHRAGPTGDASGLPRPNRKPRTEGARKAVLHQREKDEYQWGSRIRMATFPSTGAKNVLPVRTNFDTQFECR